MGASAPDRLHITYNHIESEVISMLVYVPFFKVIVLAVDVFETTIIDERHFPTKAEAEAYANSCSGGGSDRHSKDVDSNGFGEPVYINRNIKNKTNIHSRFEYRCVRWWVSEFLTSSTGQRLKSTLKKIIVAFFNGTIYNIGVERWCQFMPKKADDSLKTDSGLYKSKIEASKQYDKNNVDNIRVRVPKGWKEQMQSYVESSNKYSSVNGMICDLIQKEVDIED